MGKQVSLTCTADDPLYFLFLPWTSLPAFPGFGNTPSLFLTSCGRNPADPEEAALSFQSAAPGISVAQRVELGSLMIKTHIHSGQWKQINWVLPAKITNTPVYFSLTATPAGAGFQVPWWDTAAAALTSAATCLMPSILPPAVSQTAVAGAQGSARLRWTPALPLSLSFWPLAIAQHSALSNPCRRWCCPEEWLDKQAPCGPGSACWLSGVLSSCTPQKQPCDKPCRHYPLQLCTGELPHLPYLCQDKNRRTVHAFNNVSQQIQRKTWPILKDNYSKICTRFQRL